MGSYCPSIFTNDRWLSHFLKTGASKSEAHSVQHVLWGTQGDSGWKSCGDRWEYKGITNNMRWDVCHQNIWGLPRQGGYFTGENDENQSELEVPTGRSNLPVEIPIIGRR